jgi:hypothetical protein
VTTTIVLARVGRVELMGFQGWRRNKISYLPKGYITTLRPTITPLQKLQVLTGPRSLALSCCSPSLSSMAFSPIQALAGILLDFVNVPAPALSSGDVRAWLLCAWFSKAKRPSPNSARYQACDRSPVCSSHPSIPALAGRVGVT